MPGPKRYPKLSIENKTYEVPVRFTEAEGDLLKRIAGELGVSTSAFVREAVLRRLGLIAGEEPVTIREEGSIYLNFAHESEIGRLADRVERLLDHLEGDKS